MREKKLKQLLEFFQEGPYKIIGATRELGHILKIKELPLSELSGLELPAQIPVNSFKYYLQPFCENLSFYKKQKWTAAVKEQATQVLFGVNLLDLKAVALYDQVFEKDPFYQQRRNKTVIIGYNLGALLNYAQYKVFSWKFEEDVLEHLIFDIFLSQQKNKNWKISSGSRKGQELLEKAKITDYEHVEFAGLLKEEGADPVMRKNSALVGNSWQHPLWDELGQKCLACGKCSEVCPTCFCFDLQDQSIQGEVKKTRCASSCFYDDFSQTALNHKILQGAKEKIYFWYYHKFVRIPYEWQIPGCVSCQRCNAVCPAKINIMDNLKRLQT